MVYDCHRQSFGFKIRCALQHAQNDLLNLMTSPQQRELAIADFRQLTEGLEKSLLRKAF